MEDISFWGNLSIKEKGYENLRKSVAELWQNPYHKKTSIEKC